MAVKNPNLLPLFGELKALLAVHSGRFLPREPEPGRYELWSNANIAPRGKPVHRPYFAGLIVQKSYVGLYYMPIYTDPGIAAKIGPELMEILKGKSCFHVKSLTSSLRREIAAALKLGFKTYEAKSWV